MAAQGCAGAGTERSAQNFVRSKFLLEPSPGINSPVAHVIGDDLHPVILPDTNTPIGKERDERSGKKLVRSRQQGLTSRWFRGRSRWLELACSSWLALDVLCAIWRKSGGWSSCVLFMFPSILLVMLDGNAQCCATLHVSSRSILSSIASSGMPDQKVCCSQLRPHDSYQPAA